MCDVKIQGYAAEMDNPAMAHLIPSNLHSKKDILFGNMPEIYQFHKRYAFKLIDYICGCFTNVVHSLSIYTSLSCLKDISEGTGSIHWLPRAGGPLLFRTGEHFFSYTLSFWQESHQQQCFRQQRLSSYWLANDCFRCRWRTCRSTRLTAKINLAPRACGDSAPTVPSSRSALTAVAPPSFSLLSNIKLKS